MGYNRTKFSATDKNHSLIRAWSLYHNFNKLTFAETLYNDYEKTIHTCNVRPFLRLYIQSTTNSIFSAPDTICAGEQTTLTATTNTGK